MNAKDISSRKFDKGFKGYNPDDVDDFLKDIADEFSKLQNENRDLEKKLEVLADKVREYREDEDALKEAMLGAQKQGNSVIAQAKEKAKKILEETLVKAEQVIVEAKYNAKKIGAEADDELKKANDDARIIREEAAGKLGAMEAEYKAAVEVNKEILLKTKNEVTRFRQKLIEDFTRVTAIIETLPEACENEFVSRTVSEYKELKKERNAAQKKAMANSPNNENAKSDDKQDAKQGNSDNSGFIPPGQNQSDPDALFDEFKTSSNIVNNGDDRGDNERDGESDNEKDVPFFKKAQRPSDNEDREVLEFGSHAKG